MIKGMRFHLLDYKNEISDKLPRLAAFGGAGTNKGNTGPFWVGSGMFS